MNRSGKGSRSRGRGSGRQWEESQQPGKGSTGSRSWGQSSNEWYESTARWREIDQRRGYASATAGGGAWATDDEEWIRQVPASSWQSREAAARLGGYASWEAALAGDNIGASWEEEASAGRAASTTAGGDASAPAGGDARAKPPTEFEHWRWSWNEEQRQWFGKSHKPGNPTGGGNTPKGLFAEQNLRNKEKRQRSRVKRDEEDDRDPDGAAGRQRQRDEKRTLDLIKNTFRVGAAEEAEMKYGAPGDWWGSSSSSLQGIERVQWPAMQQKVEANQAATRARIALREAAAAAVVAAEAVAAAAATEEAAALAVTEVAAPVARLPWD